MENIVGFWRTLEKFWRILGNIGEYWRSSKILEIVVSPGPPFYRTRSVHPGQRSGPWCACILQAPFGQYPLGHCCGLQVDSPTPSRARGSLTGAPHLCPIPLPRTSVPQPSEGGKGRLHHRHEHMAGVWEGDHPPPPALGRDRESTGIGG